jgi:hypothetical protein
VIVTLLTTEEQAALLLRELAAAREHREQLTLEMRRIAAAGMYQAVPTEQWQSRGGGEAKYLYMLFRSNSQGEYYGPAGRRKLYVGADPAKIAEARRLAANRQRWEQIAEVKDRLRIWIDQQERKIEQIALYADRWPRVEALLHAEQGSG